MFTSERRFSRRHFIRLVAGAGVAVLVGESCGSKETPQQRVARGFSSALTEGDVSGAANYIAPDLRDDPLVRQQLSSLSQQLAGCRIDEIVVRESPLGGLVGAAEQANVTFKDICGEGGMFLQGFKFRGIAVGLDQANGNYYIHPLAIQPIPVATR